VVPVRKTNSLVEEFLSGSLVEASASLRAQRHVTNMEVSVLGPLSPVGPGSALKTVSGPIPAILRLNDVELSIEPECHDGVTSMRARSVHNDRINSIEASNGEEITRLDEVGVILINIVLGFSDSQVVAHKLGKELNVGSFHVVRDVRAVNGVSVGVGTEATIESKGGVVD